MPNRPDYQLLCDQVRSLAEASSNWLPALANASALIMETLDELNWAGFYLTDLSGHDPALVLGPFQGKVACVLIPFGRGVCGAAAREDQTQLVPNVHEFPGHIACDSASNSEIVIPLHANGNVVGVLDIDSPLFDRFSASDQQGLEALVHTIESCADLSQLPLSR